MIFDTSSAPRRPSNLEAVLHRRVIDRTELILDIFARRARTREGKLQVELAQLKYLLPRLVGMGTELSRLGGGIGTRGPGETKLETDRRRIRATGVDAQAGNCRSQRASGPVAGQAAQARRGADGRARRLHQRRKDHVVQRADQMVMRWSSDALFVTLDPLVRRVMLSDARLIMERIPSGSSIGCRTSWWPHSARRSRRRADADLLLHVIDAAAPERERRRRAVRDVLTEEVGAAEVPVSRSTTRLMRSTVADGTRPLLTTTRRRRLISAVTGEGVQDLVDVVASRVSLDQRAHHVPPRLVRPGAGRSAGAGCTCIATRAEPDHRG